MKVIFADFDGVLNSHRYLTSRIDPATGVWDGGPESDQIDPEAVARLNRIIEATGGYMGSPLRGPTSATFVVVSSTWRLGKGRTALQELLTSRGFKGTVLGATGNHPPRCFEIAQWMVDYKEAGERFGPMEAFVILDDDFIGGGLQPFHVKTSMKRGLEDYEADRAIAILNGGSK